MFKKNKFAHKKKYSFYKDLSYTEKNNIRSEVLMKLYSYIFLSYYKNLHISVKKSPVYMRTREKYTRLFCLYI